MDGQKIVQILPHMKKADRVADTITSWQLNGGMDNRNNGTHHVQNHQLIQTIHEEADDIAGNHLPAFGHVEHLTAEKAQQNGNRYGNDHGKDNAGYSPYLPVGHKDKADFTCHSAQSHTEVKSHAGHNGNQQAQDQEGIPAQSGDNLIEQIPRRKTGYRNADGADNDKHQRHRVIPN